MASALVGERNTKSPHRYTEHQLGVCFREIEQDDTRVTGPLFRSEVRDDLLEKADVEKNLVEGKEFSWSWGERYFMQRGKPGQSPRARKELVMLEDCYERSEARECHLIGEETRDEDRAIDQGHIRTFGEIRFLILSCLRRKSIAGFYRGG